VIVAIGADTAVALRQRLTSAIARLRVGAPEDPDADYGPVVTAAHKQRIEEIFGPVLQMLRVETLEQGIKLVCAHPYGNGAAVFTRSGEAARRFAEQAEVGMVGINVPIPVPVAHHGFGGWKRSAFGDLNQYGTDSLRFYTRTKIVTQRWSNHAPAGSGFVMPTGKAD
jgi:malonate-semialdehyde dehydrogenase (acetylating) / methylmalonate-semialdehyde dehydrogenase